MSKERYYGNLGLSHKEVGYLRDGDVHFLEGLTQQLASTIYRLETAQELAARIHEAARYVALDRLAVSPQCGFSSSILGNRISIEDQRQKLRRVVEISREIWGD